MGGDEVITGRMNMGFHGAGGAGTIDDVIFHSR